MSNWDAEIEKRFYPGSKMEIPERRTPVQIAKDNDAWDAQPIMLPLYGVETEFFTVGMLAKALNRSPSTIRDWECYGVIPEARFRTISKDPSKARRLYTRAQVEGIVQIAREHGLTAPARGGGVRRAKIPTEFTVAVVALFQRLQWEAESGVHPIQRGQVGQ